MWLKLILLIIYVSVLFILARIIEAVSWVETGNLSSRLLDPMTLSVLKLKALLEQRGIDFEGAVEKSELTELVESSGVVTSEELSESVIEEIPQETNFTGGSHFFEQVEDAKDSVWLVQVISGHWVSSYLNDQTWNTVKKKVARFGVRVGNFDCKLDWRFCDAKGWDSSRLILGLPHDFESKSQVTLYTYSGTYRKQNIHKWIKATVSKKVHVINSDYNFQQKWMKYKEKDKDSEIRVVMFSRSEMPPLFYSALSVKFPGRIKFGIVNTETFDGETILKKIPKSQDLIYFVITKETFYNFGSRSGEKITFKSFETFLKFLYPSLNDIFVCSLILCNCLTWFELCLVQGSLLKRLAKFVWCTVKFNMALLLLWMMLLTVFQLPLQPLADVIEIGLKFVRLVGGSDFLSLIRADFSFYFSYVIFVEFSFLLYILAIGVIKYQGQDPEQEQEENLDSMEWNFAQFRTLEHLFYPVQPRMFARRSPYMEWNQEDIPSLWMAAHMSSEYIRDLPEWEYVQDKSKNKHKFPADQYDNSSSNTRGNMDETEKDLPESKSMDPSLQDDAATPSDDRQPHTLPHGESQKSGSSVPAGYLEGTQCVICLDNYFHGVVLCGLPCGHCFHKKCITTWLTRDNHYCPVCRCPSNKPKLGLMHLHSE